MDNVKSIASIVIIPIFVIALLGGCTMNSTNPTPAYETYITELPYDTEKLALLSIPSKEVQDAINEKPDEDPAPGSGQHILEPFVNAALAEKKGLADENGLTERFFILQTLYRKYLEIYICGELNLLRYDNKISSNSLGFKPLEREWQGYYQTYSMMGLDYVYLRNTVYIERLSIEQIDLLEDYLFVGGQTKEEEIEQLVKDTWLIAIQYVSDEYLLQYGKTHETQGGFYGGGNSALNNAIVLGISFDTLEENGPDEQHRTYLRETLIPEMEQQLSGKMGDSPVNVFVY